MDIAAIPGIGDLWKDTQGDPRICIAVLDGPVDRGHGCFTSSEFAELPAHPRVDDEVRGKMGAHGTHVASVLFGRHESDVRGVAPGCRGLLVPVLSERRRTKQLDLARAIERSVDAGAQVINISGGQLTLSGEADGWLERAVEFCRRNDVLLVAAAGNDGCDCLQVPAAVESVLAVGAMDDDGNPLDFSNWGPAYHSQGVLTYGRNILGAVPGGGTRRESGTSLATPIVSGVAALLLSQQLRRGQQPSPHVVREAILQGAERCEANESCDCSRYLVGKLSISGADRALRRITARKTMSIKNACEIREACTCQTSPANQHADQEMATSDVDAFPEVSAIRSDSGIRHDIDPRASSNGQRVGRESRNGYSDHEAPADLRGSSRVADVLQPAAVPDEETKGLVFALGTLGFDFGTEARRDTFKQLIAPQQYSVPVEIPWKDPDSGEESTRTVFVSYPNPYDVGTLWQYFKDHPSEMRHLIWTLNLEGTPIYAIQPYETYAGQVYDLLRDLMYDQVPRVEEDDNKLQKISQSYVERVSVPGILAGRTVRLFSGQAVPVIEVDGVRGLYGWKTNEIIAATLDAMAAKAEIDRQKVEDALSGFLNRVYFDYRNLGVTSQDRALNYAVTNLVQTATAFARAFAGGRELDDIQVIKSPTCRPDSDCWDVKLKFFDPENLQRSRTVYRFTIDVSDKMPVTLSDVRTWSQGY